jgi:hypothetical protein
MVLQFKHTAISPLTGTLKTTTNTATARNLETGVRRVRFPLSGARNEFNIALAVRIQASTDSQHGMKARHNANTSLIFNIIKKYFIFVNIVFFSFNILYKDICIF